MSQESEEKVADLTPMLNVVFIMLIFFIVTATFIKETGVEVTALIPRRRSRRRPYRCWWA
ncbi:MAG: biopolymer transporter ExbD [Desulfurivibrio sp.]|nr:biopolymer transporter ExbD [Desulfurivibrio sp.]